MNCSRYARLAVQTTLLAALIGCGGGDSSSSPTPEPTPDVVPRQDLPQRLVILGFDGVDPDVIQEFWDEGLLPNLKALAESGHFGPLESTNPPQSPVAWSSFATGRHPGDHGIYDFVSRNPQRYLPMVGSGSVSAARFDDAGNRTQAPSAVNNRNGESFWSVASNAGVPVRVLNVPFAFPVDDIPYGEHHAGLGTPDLRGTNSTCFFWSTRYGEDEPGAGGTIKEAIDLSAGPVTVSAEGPRGTDGRAAAEIVFEDVDGGVSIAAGGRTETVAAGSWSDWYDLGFTTSPSTESQAAVRFYVIENGAETTIYMFPLMYHWRQPHIPLTDPPEYAGQLMERYGPYKTIGWVHDTSALNSEQLPDQAFLEDAWRTMEWRRQMTLGELASNEAPVFISVFTAPDRVSHMFWRLRDPTHPRYDAALAAELGDPVQTSYEKMDVIVGEIVEALPEDAALMIVSDHGFHSFRRGLHVNSWLVQEGYLTLRDGASCSDGDFFADVDWSQTRAYALGTGQIYINLRGREGSGVVRFGADYNNLVEEIRTKLLAVQDNGTQVFTSVVAGSQEYSGERSSSAPDLQMGFAGGYQTSWATKLGGIPCGPLFEDNQKLWSGDHAASHRQDTSGILFLNRPLPAGTPPSIIDVAPTVLDFVGLPTADYPGRDLID